MDSELVLKESEVQAIVNGLPYHFERKGGVIYAKVMRRFRGGVEITFYRVDGCWYFDMQPVQSYPGAWLPERLEWVARRLL